MIEIGVPFLNVQKTTEDQKPAAEPEEKDETKLENQELCAESGVKDEIGEILKEKEDKIKDLQVS